MLQIPTDELVEELPEKQQDVLTALMQTATIRDAARVAQVSESTIYNYKRDPAFRDAYRKARRDALEQARRGLEDLAVTANQALKEVLQNPDSPANAKVAAARSIWTLITRSADDEELADLLDELRESNA
jgi:hypothetical protein